MDESHYLRFVQIISILMFTKSAFSQSPQWIQANGCLNVTYRGTVFNLTNNSPATCFKACGNTTESVALRFMECACNPYAYRPNGFSKIFAQPCSENTNTNCGCVISNNHLWSLYESDETAFVDILNNLNNEPSAERRCISAHKDDNTIKYEFEECTNRHSTLCSSELMSGRYTSEPHSWQEQMCDNPAQTPVPRGEINSQNLNINSKLWTDVFIEYGKDPKILAIIYNPSVKLDSSRTNPVTPIGTTQLNESLQEMLYFNSNSSISAQIEFSQTSELTSFNTEKTADFDVTLSLSDSPQVFISTTAFIKVIVETSIIDISGSQFLDSLTSFEKHAPLLTESSSVRSQIVSLNNQESTSLTLANYSQQTSATHSHTILPSFIIVSETQFHTSNLSLTHINQQEISRSNHLTIEQYTKPPSAEYIHRSNTESLSFTISSESVASSVIKPTHMQGSSSIDLTPRLGDQSPKPESLLGTFSDIKAFVIVIMTAVICGMIGVVTALLLINRTLVESQKEMARMNDLLSRKLRGIDTCDELPLTSIVDDIGTGSMRRLESRPNEYTFSSHNENDNESRQSSHVGNLDNEMATRTNEFPPFSFSTRSDLRRYDRSYSRPFGPMASSD